MTEHTNQLRRDAGRVAEFRRLRPWYALLWLAMCLAVSPAQANELSAQIFAHKDIPDEYLSRNYLRSVFTMRVRSWPDGQGVRVFVLAENDPLHLRFCQQVLGTYPYVLSKAWSRTVFTGRGLLPEVVGSIEEMRRKVQSTPGAVGYVPAEQTRVFRKAYSAVLSGRQTS